MTGVVRKLLKATAPVSRRDRVSVVGCTVSTCTCNIWSCGMVNSSGLFELFAPPEFAAALDPEPWQPASTSMITEKATGATNRCQRLRTLMVGFSFPPLPSVVPERSYKRPVLGDKLTERIGNCA